MRQTVEEMLGYFNQIRRVYANELNLKFTNELKQNPLIST